MKTDCEVENIRQEQYGMIDDYLKSGMDALVIANNWANVKFLFEKTFTFLLPGGAFCIYNSFIQPLAEVYDWIKENDIAINLRLSELWHREYQVETITNFSYES
jgi:tRNA A58 N-methylase Trm61